MLRVLDIVLAGVGLLLAMPLMALLFLVGMFDTGAPLFWQTRVGRYQQPFTLVKFRTMRPDTQSVATHLADASTHEYTRSDGHDDNLICSFAFVVLH